MYESVEPRFKKRVPCELSYVGDTYPGIVLNVSRGGLQVELEEDITVGALLQVCVELPNADDPLYLVGEVRWCRPGSGDEGPWMAGFQLMNAVNSDIHHWRELVERLES